MKETIRVIYVLNATTMFGGANKSFLAMLELLSQKGVEALVVTPDTDGIYKHLRDRGISTLALNYRVAAFPPIRSFADRVLLVPRLCGRLLSNHFAARRLAQVCKEFRADLVHTNVSVINIGFNAAHYVGIPHLWHVREYGDLDFGYHYIWSKRQQIERYRQCNSYTVCITKNIQSYNKLSGNESSKVIYNGVISGDEKLPDSRKNNYFLFVGRLEQAKGIIELLNAYSEYTKQVSEHLPLYIAGDTDSEQYKHLVVSTIESLGVQNDVKILGMCDNVNQLYADALAVIVPSAHEGFGRVVVEAMNMGCPVIGRDSAGIREQFENGRVLTGGEIGFGYSNNKQLVNLLINISTQKEQHLEDITSRALNAVRKLYTMKANADSVFQFYQSILNK